MASSGFASNQEVSKVSTINFKEENSGKFRIDVIVTDGNGKILLEESYYYSSGDCNEIANNTMEMLSKIYSDPTTKIEVIGC